jgi:predicted dehydrogenase
MDAINNSRVAELAAVVEPNTDALDTLKCDLPGIQLFESFHTMLESDVDGIVIATPSALHARQALEALNAGKAVFCQKPLGRTEAECRQVVETARKQNLLLGVDYSYRHTKAMQKVKQIVASGDLGQIYGVHLAFHNAYGPDKAWYFDPERAGGGCLMDLGIHLVDLLFWVFEEPQVTGLFSRLFHNGRPMDDTSENQVEDYAAAQLELNHSIAVQLSCSWNLPAGRNAVIEARFYGEHGGVAFRNKDGSFYDFTTEQFVGTQSHTLVAPPDDWEGRAAVEWSRRLAKENCFDPKAESYVQVAQVLDLIYERYYED